MNGLVFPIMSWWVLACAFHAPVSGQVAQGASQPKRISLSMQRATLRDVAAKLGEDAGCTVDVADYLYEREVTLNFKGVTIEDALSALCDLHDWVWRETEPGHYTVLRKPVQLPKQPSDMERCFKAALPCDLRHYLGEGVLTDTMKEYDARQKPAPGVLTFSMGSSPASPVFMARAENAVVKEAQTLHDTIRPNVAVGQRTEYLKLPTDQRKRLLVHLLLRAVSNTEPGLVLAHEKLPPYVMDLRTATLELMGGRLMVMSYVREGDNTRGYGFGGSPVP